MLCECCLIWEDEDMYLFVSDDFAPADEASAAIFRQIGEYTLPECDEGELRWIPAGELMALPMWEGLYNAITGYVDNITLQDMIDNYNSANGGDYCI